MPDSNRPRRRARYQGTHPRQFEQKYKELQTEAYPGMQEHVRQRGMTPAGTHVPVLTAEVMEALRPQAGEIVADCTLGYGGHAAAFLEKTTPDGLLVGFDVDGEQLERTGERLASQFTGQRIRLFRSNYAGAGNVLGELGIDGYDIIFADLGVSSMQIDDPRRGFSYKHEGPLDMRMDARLKRTAADLLQSFSAEELSTALWELADEPDHEAIARAIAAQRANGPIRTTSQLVELIFAAKGIDRRAWRRDPDDTHPASLTFQALRIVVNDELGSLRHLMRVAPYCLRAGGRIGIISFQSGEDRLVKHAFRDGVREGLYAEASTDVVRAGPQERRSNPRSAPAKFRWARKASAADGPGA